MTAVSTGGVGVRHLYCKTCFDSESVTRWVHGLNRSTEVMRVVHGLALRPFVCDGCARSITLGMPAVAFSVARTAFPEPWEKSYISEPDATEVDEPATLEQQLLKAFRLGWEKGVRDFAIWSDGEQLVGCTQRPLAAVLEKGPTDAGDIPYRGKP